MTVSFSQTPGAGSLYVQKSYSLRHQIAELGMIGDDQPYISRSGLNNSGAVIPYGRLVSKDTTNGADPQAVKEYAGASDILLGLSFLSEVNEKIVTAAQAPGFTYSATGGYPTGFAVNIISQGNIYVAAAPSVAISIGDPVHYYFTGSNKGTFSNVGTANQSVTLTQVRFLDAVAATAPDNNTARLIRLEILHPGVGAVAD